MKSVSILSIVGAVAVILGIAVVFARKETFRGGGGSSGVALHYGGGGTGQPDSELGSSLY
jgi:hypothetical protein